MKLKILIGLLLLVMLTAVAFGYSACDVDQNCYLYHEVVENETTGVVIQLTNEWGYMIINDSMDQYFNNTYQYVYAFTQEGEYNYTALVYNGTTLLSSNYETVVVGVGTSYNVFLILGFIFVLVMILFSFVGKHAILGVFSSVALLILGITFVYQIQIIGWLMIVSGLILASIFTFSEL